MKTTVEIPNELMKAIKLRALQEGKKLTEIMRELLVKGLTLKPKRQKLRICTDDVTGFPVLRGGKTPTKELTPEQLSEILNEQEASYYIPSR